MITMIVEFYTLSKRINSTKIPDVTGKSYNCILKDRCSVVDPKIILKWDGSGSPAGYNYAHISDFGRYYWVSNWTYEDRCWEASLSVDVLASFKTDIGNARKYVLRSASDNNPMAMDTLPKSTCATINREIDITNPNFATDFKDGAFVVGVVGQYNTFNVNGSGYIVLHPGALQYLIDTCFNDSFAIWQTYGPSLGNNIGEVMAVFGELYTKSIANPIQFVNSVVWLPFAPAFGDPVPVYLGSIFAGNFQTLENPIKKFNFTVSVPTTSNFGHSTGYWDMVEPYSVYRLVLPPFGVFNLSGPLVLKSDNGNGSADVEAEIVIDCITGQATLSIPKLAINAGAQLGIPVDLAGRSVDYFGMGQAISSAAGSLVAINAAGVVNGISNVAVSEQPAATQGYIGGGMAALNSRRYASLLYYIPTELDIADKGMVLCQTKQISTLSGYVLCDDGEINVSCTDQELSMIGRYLTGGFYYE